MGRSRPRNGEEGKIGDSVVQGPQASRIGGKRGKSRRSPALNKRKTRALQAARVRLHPPGTYYRTDHKTYERFVIEERRIGGEKTPAPENKERTRSK